MTDLHLFWVLASQASLFVRFLRHEIKKAFLFCIYSLSQIKKGCSYWSSQIWLMWKRQVMYIEHVITLHNTTCILDPETTFKNISKCIFKSGPTAFVFLSRQIRFFFGRVSCTTIMMTSAMMGKARRRRRCRRFVYKWGFMSRILRSRSMNRGSLGYRNGADGMLVLGAVQIWKYLVKILKTLIQSLGVVYSPAFCRPWVTNILINFTVTS